MNQVSINSYLIVRWKKLGLSQIGRVPRYYNHCVEQGHTWPKTSYKEVEVDRWWHDRCNKTIEQSYGRTCITLCNSWEYQENPHDILTSGLGENQITHNARLDSYHKRYERGTPDIELICKVGKFTYVVAIELHYPDKSYSLSVHIKEMFGKTRNNACENHLSVMILMILLIGFEIITASWISHH